MRSITINIKKKKKSPPEGIPLGPPLNDHVYNKIDVTDLKVRGKNYMHDKIKIPAKEPIFQLEHVDMFFSKEPVRDWGRNRHSYCHYLNKHKGDKRLKLIFLINMTPYHCAVTWALDTSNSNSNSNKDKEKEKKKHHHHHDEEKKKR